MIHLAIMSIGWHSRFLTDLSIIWPGILLTQPQLAYYNGICVIEEVWEELRSHILLNTQILYARTQNWATLYKCPPPKVYNTQTEWAGINHSENVRKVTLPANATRYSCHWWTINFCEHVKIQSFFSNLCRLPILNIRMYNEVTSTNHSVTSQTSQADTHWINQ